MNHTQTNDYKELFGAVIAINSTIFHHEKHALRELDIVERVARHRHHVGQFAAFESADFVGEPEQISGCGGACQECLRIGHAIGR